MKKDLNKTKELKKDSRIGFKEGDQESKEALNTEKSASSDKNETTEPSWQTEINELKNEINRLDDLYKRKAAEFENYKKRIIQESEKQRLLANRELIMEIVPIVDNFERGLKAAEQTQNFEALTEGIRMAISQFHDVFEKFFVKPIEAVGLEFDPNLHEAVVMEERDDIDYDLQITEEFEKGYTIGDMVIKPSKVKVAKRKKATSENN